jgi:hypothetical protein
MLRPSVKEINVVFGSRSDRLLRARRERPPHRCAAEPRDEIAPYQ